MHRAESLSGSAVSVIRNGKPAEWSLAACDSDSGEGFVILVGAAILERLELNPGFSHFLVFSLATCIGI